jgi:hypothetical protein
MHFTHLSYKAWVLFFIILFSKLYTMKCKLLFTVTLILTICMFSCKKGDVGPAGPQGEAGPQGPQGPQGIAGNANVTQYTYGVQNLVASFAQLQVTTTRDTMDKSAWFVYLYYQPIDRWYFIPGYGNGGATQYRISMGYASNKVSIYIDKNGPGESYAQAKIIRIYTSSQQTGGRSVTNPALPAGIDFSNYEAVRNYYQLP